MKKIYCEIKKCLSCRRCEIACYLKNSGAENIFEAVKLEKGPVKNIELINIDKASFPFNCRQCSEPLCVDACISGALYIDKEKGVVLIDKEKCVGCYSCIMRCPNGSIKIVKDMVSKCDLCEGRDIPECVKACPTGALRKE